MIKKYTFESGVPGKNVLITGAVHGNEPCGAIALQELVEKFEQGELSLTSGTLVVVPVCNPEAYKQKVRQTEENLNRVFYHTDTPKTYEQKLAQQILSLIDWADVMVDLHSISGTGHSFALVESDDKDLFDYVRQIASHYMVCGFSDLLVRKNIGDFHTTQKYAVETGKLATVMECGNHDLPETITTAKITIQKLFDYLGNVKGAFYKIPEMPAPKVIRMEDVFYKTKEGRYTKNWLNFEPIKKDTVIALYDDGEEIKAPCDCVMVMPGQFTKIGEDWFYLGVEEA